VRSDPSRIRAASVSATIVTVACAALSGCGGGSKTPSAATTPPVTGTPPASTAPTTSTTSTTAPNACKVFTKSLARSYLGSSAKLAIHAKPNPQETQCEYRGTGGFIAVMAGNWTVIQSEATNGKPVAGLGDQALIAPSGLAIRKGLLGVSVLVAADGSFSGSAANHVAHTQDALEKKLGRSLLKNL
jgi:hypothetical protein